MIGIAEKVVAMDSVARRHGFPAVPGEPESVTRTARAGTMSQNGASRASQGVSVQSAKTEVTAS
jgi:hypothetical protein